MDFWTEFNDSHTIGDYRLNGATNQTIGLFVRPARRSWKLFSFNEYIEVYQYAETVKWNFLDRSGYLSSGRFPRF